MDGGDVRALARPLERLMNEIDDDTASEEIRPQRWDSNALRDGVGSDKRASSLRAVNKVSGFFEPARNIIKVAITGNARENFCHVRFLRGVLKTFADERRVANDVIDVGSNGSPIKSKRVTFVNVSVAFERQKI